MLSLERLTIRLLKRLAIWLLETSLEALMLAVVLVVLFGCDRHEYGRCVGVCVVAIGTMFFSTGYLATTAIARALVSGGKLWPYPAIAVVLFLAHFEVLNYSAGGFGDKPTRTVIRVAGACIVVACTVAGTLLLRRWTASTGEQSGTQS